MYRKSADGWLKHLDFILLDLVCLQFSFVLAYWARSGFHNPYRLQLYSNQALIFALVQIIVSISGESFKNVLKRGFFLEFKETLKHTILITLWASLYLFIVQNGEAYSRIAYGLTSVFYFCISYPVRSVWKWYINRALMAQETKNSLLIVTVSSKLENIKKNIENNEFKGYKLAGIAVIDKDLVGGTLCAVPIVANKDTVLEYACRAWVDEVFLKIRQEEESPEKLIRGFMEMGIVLHIVLVSQRDIIATSSTVEKMGPYTVVTTCANTVSYMQYGIKKAMDIVGGILGCILTGILFIFVAPVIYIKSPGPIFFAQTRVGKNGKQFKMYKFRSMYLDAEEKKKELMAQNKMENDFMFKIEDDPRIIGSRNKSGKGIGHFIRKTSIDEFPQFFNVLKGDMSLVGTRPPTLDEWNKYELHHRKRLSIKPGITGMWQVSGRSNITDFDQVVELDAKYITNWNLGLDIKILFKTIFQVFKKDGSY